MTDISKDLLSLKDKATEANRMAEQSKGRLSTYYDQLKEFGFDTVEEGNDYYNKESEDIDKAIAELRTKTDDLKNKMSGEDDD